TFVLFPFRFELFSGTVASGTPDSVNVSGQFTDLADGNYVLVVYDNLTGCGAVEIPFTIDRVETEPVIATTITDDTNCDTNNGSVEVSASMSTTEPASYTYEIFNGHAFTTLDDSEIINDGSAAVFDQLAPGDYRIRVTNDDTRCSSFEDIVVNDDTVIPAFSTSQTINDNTSCDPLNATGFISVSIQGDAVSNYQFSWWIGTNTSGAPDFGPTIGGGSTNGNSLSGLTAGDYTVIAENITTGCETVALTLEVDDDPYIPNIVISETPQTSCSTGNGELSAIIDNDPDLPPGTSTTTGFSFQWQLDGVNLVNGVDPGNGSNPSGVQTAVLSGLVADEYTLVVTHNSTNCPSTENFTLTTNQVIPSLALDDVEPNTSCNPANSDGEIHVVATPTGTYNFEYYFSDGTQVVDGGSVSGSTTADVTGLINDTYKVVAVSPSPLECPSDTLTVVVNANPTTPAFAVDGTGTNNNTVCDITIAGDFNGQITVAPTDASNPADYSYAWFVGASTDAGDDLLTNITTAALSTTGDVASELPGGTYTVVITDVSNTSNNCTTTIQ
ncbi:MAG: hypothetical protein AAFY41_10695, partial [Bacteroidota bacterium]